MPWYGWSQDIVLQVFLTLFLFASPTVTNSSLIMFFLPHLKMYCLESHWFLSAQDSRCLIALGKNSLGSRMALWLYFPITDGSSSSHSNSIDFRAGMHAHTTHILCVSCIVYQWKHIHHLYRLNWNITYSPLLCLTIIYKPMYRKVKRNSSKCPVNKIYRRFLSLTMIYILRCMVQSSSKKMERKRG